MNVWQGSPVRRSRKKCLWLERGAFLQKKRGCGSRTVVAHAQFSSHRHFFFFFKKCTVLEPQPLFFQKMGPWPQDGTKIGPRSPQVGLKTVLTCDRFWRRFSDRFLVVFGLRFGALLGPQGAPKINPSRAPWAWRATATSFAKYEPRPRREHDFHPPGSPRWHQHRPKIVPSRS